MLKMGRREFVAPPAGVVPRSPPRCCSFDPRDANGLLDNTISDSLISVQSSAHFYTRLTSADPDAHCFVVCETL